MQSEPCPVLCLINWETSSLMVDDGSYLNWLEGLRTLETAIGFLPLEVLRLASEPRMADVSSLRPARLGLGEGVEALRLGGASRVLVAGNSVEHEVTPFAEALARLSFRPVILFDVCGTLDPMAKWQSLARAVDNGVAVSTVQQVLGAMLADMRRQQEGRRHGLHVAGADRDAPMDSDGLVPALPGPDLAGRLGALLGAAFGEHAGELSAA